MITTTNDFFSIQGAMKQKRKFLVFIMPLANLIILVRLRISGNIQALKKIG
jgi:hypothetical protein